MPRNLAGNRAGTRSKENRFKLVQCGRKEGHQFSGRMGRGLDLRSALEDFAVRGIGINIVCAELEFGSSSSYFLKLTNQGTSEGKYKLLPRRLSPSLRVGNVISFLELLEAGPVWMCS